MGKEERTGRRMWVKEQEKGCRGGVFRVDGRGKM